MQVVRSISPGLLPGEEGGSSYNTAESSADVSSFVPFLVSLIVKLEAWYGQFNTASRLILFTSLLCSFSITLSWYSGRLTRGLMARYMLLFLPALATLSGLSLGQQTPSTTTSALNSAYTVPADADVGQPIIPNIIDPKAVNPQSVCPGYRAFTVQTTSNALTAGLTLAGKPCNVYGTDIKALTLVVEYQAEDRLHIEIHPSDIGRENYTWFVLPEELIPKPQIDKGYDSNASPSDLDFTWSNDPTFSFKVVRKSTADVLFNTEGSHLVYEDQFIEFVSSLPENYNLYGLGEVIHGFRLGNNFTRMAFSGI